MRFTTILLALACCPFASAVEPSPELTAAISANGKLISAVFSQKVTAGGPQVSPQHIRLIKAKPDTARVINATRNVLDATEVTLGIAPAITDPEGLRVCFDSVEYEPATSGGKPKLSQKEVCADVQSNVDELKSAALAALKSVPKNSNEKSIFASGFVTTASGGSAGGADISLNPDLGLKGMTTFLNIKKTTQPNGDAKHFEAGVRYQNVLPWGRQLIRDMAAANDLIAMGALLKKQQDKVIAGAVFDFATKLEGEPTHFQVTNSVGETGLSLRTMTKGFANRHGFWRGFVLPAAFEGGRSLSQGQGDSASAASTAQKPDWIARYKVGAGMTFFYNDWSSSFPFRRVELDMNGVGRNLFFKETTYNSQSKTTDSTGKGIRGYAQVDLKLYVGQSDKARYGLKLSYNRGSLPPVFARVKSFQFGFLYESTDDNTSGK
jgi:hypothetical protein